MLSQDNRTGRNWWNVLHLVAPTRKCFRCDGTGKVRVCPPEMEPFDAECPICQGRGWVFVDEDSPPCNSECKKCVFREDCYADCGGWEELA
ncbi:MAG: hypothetical protein QXP27_00485 [Candidatus Methanomethyliaceae archaeon]